MEAGLRAIAEPRRRAIIRLVRDREMPAGAIAAHFDCTRQAVSQHLRVLKDSGLLTERRDGARRLYRARAEGLRDIRRTVEELWSDRLDVLAAAAERRAKGRRRG